MNWRVGLVIIAARPRRVPHLAAGNALCMRTPPSVACMLLHQRLFDKSALSVAFAAPNCSPASQIAISAMQYNKDWTTFFHDHGRSLVLNGYQEANATEQSTSLALAWVTEKFWRNHTYSR